MRRHQVYLIAGLAAAIAGCAARADEERRGADDNDDVRIDKAAIRALLEPARQVSVVGTSKVAVVPDVAEISMGVSTSRPTAPEAVAANNQAMNSLVESIKKRGIAAKDIQTSHVTITPQYSRPAEGKPGEPPEATVAKVVGYEVSNMVRVTIRELAKLGEYLDLALNAGSNQFYGISFRIGDREAVLGGLRNMAFDDAKQKASLYAKRSGLALGPVVQITETEPGWSPGAPMHPNYPMVMAAPAAPSMSVHPGEQEVSLSVSVSYELKSPK